MASKTETINNLKMEVRSFITISLVPNETSAARLHICVGYSKRIGKACSRWLNHSCLFLVSTSRGWRTETSTKRCWSRRKLLRRGRWRRTRRWVWWWGANKVKGRVKCFNLKLGWCLRSRCSCHLLGWRCTKWNHLGNDFWKHRSQKLIGAKWVW